MFLRLKLRNSPCGLTNITQRILLNNFLIQVTFRRRRSMKYPFLLKISQYTLLGPYNTKSSKVVNVQPIQRPALSHQLTDML